MCVVSMIMEHFEYEWGKYVQPRQPVPFYPWKTDPPESIQIIPIQVPIPLNPEEEFRRFYELYKRAKAYDVEHHEKDCELASKKEAIRKLAQEIGIPLEKIDGVLDGKV